MTPLASAQPFAITSACLGLRQSLLNDLSKPSRARSALSAISRHPPRAGRTSGPGSLPDLSGSNPDGAPECPKVGAFPTCARPGHEDRI